jgi:hypothetical protein
LADDAGVDALRARDLAVSRACRDQREQSSIAGSQLLQRYLNVDPTRRRVRFRCDMGSDLQGNEAPLASPTIDSDVASDPFEPGRPSRSRRDRIRRAAGTKNRLRRDIVCLVSSEASAQVPPEGIAVLDEPSPSFRALGLMHLPKKDVCACQL